MLDSKWGCTQRNIKAVLWHIPASNHQIAVYCSNCSHVFYCLCVDESELLTVCVQDEKGQLVTFPACRSSPSSLSWRDVTSPLNSSISQQCFNFTPLLSVKLTFLSLLLFSSQPAPRVQAGCCFATRHRADQVEQVEVEGLNGGGNWIFIWADGHDGRSRDGSFQRDDISEEQGCSTKIDRYSWWPFKEWPGRGLEHEKVSSF